MIPQVIDGHLFFIDMEGNAMTTEPTPEDTTPDPEAPTDEDAANAPYPDPQPDAEEDF